MKVFKKEDIPNESYDNELEYHCVWFGKYYTHHVLCIASILATQKNPKITVWTDTPSLDELKKIEEIFSNYGDRVKVRVGDDGTILDCESYLQLTFRSDKWRYEILSKFGGVYFDMDVLFLKDLSWCAAKNIYFVQEGFISEKVFNTALVYYPKGHQDILKINEKIGRNYLGWGELFNYQKYDDELSCVLLDNSITDNGWSLAPIILSWDRFFEDTLATSDDYLLNICDSIVYHWHNRYDRPIKEGTIVGYYWNKFVKENPLIKHDMI